MSKNKTASLFENLDELSAWAEEWRGMPEFVQADATAYQQINVSFLTKEDVDSFAKLIGQKITYKTNSLWFPKQDYLKPKFFVYTQEKK